MINRTIIHHRPRWLLDSIQACISVENHDAMYWPIECAAAWIAGSDCGVARFFNSFIEYMKKPPSLSDVYYTIIDDKFSINLVMISKEYHSCAMISSRMLFRTALTDGSIRAYGADSRITPKRTVQIPSEEWDSLRIELSPRHGLIESFDGQFAYDSVRVRSADLLRVFPVSNHRHDDIDARIRQLAAETDSDFIGQNTLFEKMRAEFPEVTREKIREAHKHIFGERSRGRPSKKRPSA